jgi:rhodanese-related sulfurtransferase
MIPAIAAGAFHPKAPPWEDRVGPGEVSLNQALEWGKDVLWLDARPRQAYQREHVPGALSLNLENWDEAVPQVLQAWSPGRPIVVYCDSGGCHASKEVAEKLRTEMQLGNVFVLHGGWGAWLRHGGR